jgi:hypothetical protein
MLPVNVEPVALAILAKAPVPGFAKTRLMPELGAHGAAALQECLTERAVETACAAAIGPVTLWCAPDSTHVSFRDLAARFALTLATQPDTDLGNRMLAAIAAAKGPVIVIGADCPALTAGHLRAAADALRDHDAVLIPVEDGGYVLIGLRAARDQAEWNPVSRPDHAPNQKARARSDAKPVPTFADRALVPRLFDNMEWSTPEVIVETRRRLAALGLTWKELPTLWDVDTPANLDRLRAAGLMEMFE